MLRPYAANLLCAQLFSVSMGFVILPPKYYPLDQSPSRMDPKQPPNQLQPQLHNSVVTSLVSNVSSSDTANGIAEPQGTNKSQQLDRADNSTAPAELVLKLKMKTENKNPKDMYEVSKYLQSSVRGAVLKAIKKNLGGVLENKVLKALDESLAESFKKMQKDAVHVDGDASDTKEITLKVPL